MVVGLTCARAGVVVPGKVATMELVWCGVMRRCVVMETTTVRWRTVAHFMRDEIRDGPRRGVR